MYKKLMFLISLVALLGLASSALAADFEIPWGTTHIVIGVEEYGDMKCEGTCIVPAGATLILNDESEIDHDGTDGPGNSEYAQLIVDGGTFIMKERINLGKDHDAYLIVQNGGTIIHTKEKICIPDNDYGVHRLIVANGTVVSVGIELDEREERYSSIQLGCSAVAGEIVAKITTANTDYGSYGRWDPDVWKTREPNEGGLYGYPNDVCPGAATLIVNDLGDTDLGDDVKEVFYFIIPPQAWNPSPEDGATEICPDTCLTWEPGDGMGGHPGDKHYIFFGECETACDAQIGDSDYYSFKPVGMEEFCPMDPLGANLDLELWHTYCWRIDEKPFGLDTVTGDCWSYTTGCAIMPGDINLDCVVDGADFAMLADDWMTIAFFPDDF